MIFTCKSIPEGYEAGIRELLAPRGHEICREGCAAGSVALTFRAVEGDSIRGVYTVGEDGNGGEAVLTAGHKTFFFRALMRLVRELEKKGAAEAFAWEEPVFLDRNGTMLDCSRNSVLTVETIKKYIRMQAAVGMNTLMLYTEDTYEVPEYPYFGYMRGRYTKEELREMTDYAELFGIEMIPCIQALAHLKNALRWAAMAGMQDTDDILMSGDEKVYDFVKACIKNATEPFHTKRVHLGMDEAWALGLGKYLHKNGYHDKSEIMAAHLERVDKICKELGLEPMIWSDMYLRMVSEHNEYYDIPLDADLSGAVKPPKGVTLVYWDYYHEDEEFYKEYLRMHRQLSEQVIFAGGGWVWNGVSPNLELAKNTTEPAMKACKKAGVREAVCTMWQDNGAETPMLSGLPSIIRFAEHGFAEEVSEETIDAQLEFLTGCSAEALNLLGSLDHVNPSCTYDNPSKFLLYQDVLTGLFDAQTKGWDADAYYAGLRDRLNGICEDWRISNAEKTVDESVHASACLMLEMYGALADALSVKADLGKKIYEAYHADDKEELRRLAQQDISLCMEKIEAYRNLREKVWDDESKIFGWEVIDIRFGGLFARLKSAQKRLNAYLDGALESLSELEEERLLFQPAAEGKEPGLLNCNQWVQIVSASPM